VVQTSSSDSEDYVSLYRRYRPQRFDQLAGQEHVALALSHAVETGKVPHAYLLSGPRGTGKTSAARILAKALNCESPTGGEPCNVCASCISITEGASLDVVELDAASHNGVEDVRELIASVSLATPGRYRVFIVDEVHMLSNAASNALLKTLEEPPSHVVFVLATTDPHKVPATIRSRTVHLHFNLLDGALLESLLSSVAEKEAMELGREVIDRAVGLAKGSARDALSALEHLAVAGVKGVQDEQRIISDLLEGIVEGDSQKALSAVSSGVHAGMEPSRIASGAIEVLRQGFLSLLAPELVELAPPDKERVGELARSFGLAPLVAAIEALGKALSEMPSSYDPLVPLELAVVRIVSPELSLDLGVLQRRVERIESRLDQALAGLSQGVAAPSRAPSPPRPKDSPQATPKSGPAPRGEGPASASASEPLPCGEGPRATPGSERSKETHNHGLRPGDGDGNKKFFGALHREALNSGVGQTVPTAAGSPEGPSGASKQGAEPGIALVEEEAAAVHPGPQDAAKSDDLHFDRDFLTREWPGILGELSVPARAVARLGRFLAVEGTAVTMALPQKGHVEAASRHKREIEAAIARAFGLSGVALFLVVDEPDGAHPAPKPSSRTPAGGDAGAHPAGAQPDGAHPAPKPASSVPAETQFDPRPTPKPGISDKSSLGPQGDRPTAEEESVPEHEPELDGEPEDPVQLTLRFFPGSSVEDLEEQP